MARRWFQIHLSTAVVLMLVAGVLLWLNMCERYFNYSGEEVAYLNSATVSMGWPFSVYEWYIEDLFIQRPPLNKLHIRSIVLNLFVSTFTLLGVAVFCEWGIRRSTLKSAPDA